MREVKADIRVDPAWRGWVREVLEQVRFWPDHRAIQKELLAHLEDGRADLERLGYPGDLARERALQAMGDAKAVGWAMDLAHRPWLGWLWQASRVLAALALAALLYSAAFGGSWPDVRSWLDPASQVESGLWESGGGAARPQTVRMGAYTLRVESVDYGRNEGPGGSELSVRLMSETPRFWLGAPALNDLLEAEDSNGVRYTNWGAPAIYGGSDTHGHIRSSLFIQIDHIEGSPSWIDIRHKTAGWSFRLELPQGEEETP